MSPADRQAQRIATDRLAALRTRLGAAPQGTSDSAKAARRLTLRSCSDYVAKWPSVCGPEAKALRDAHALLDAYREGCLPTPPPASVVLTVGALRALLVGLPDGLALTQVLADPGTIAAIAQSLALVPPIRRPIAARPRSDSFRACDTPEAMGLF